MLKVFRMDDYQWHAGESLEQCIELYEQESGEKYDLKEFNLYGYPEECDIETNGVWCEIEPSNSGKIIPLVKNKDKDTFGDRKMLEYSLYCEYMSFKDAHEYLSTDFPYVIACTEI